VFFFEQNNVINLTKTAMGTHHLEYGFPSTHSTNSVSIALFFFTRLHVYYSASGDGVYGVVAGALTWYVFSIVFGRLYTAMHSFTDCVVGVAMGAGIWWVHDGYWGLGAGAWVEGLVEGHGIVGEYFSRRGRANFFLRQGNIVPMVVVPLCLIMVNQHPQPVDDCPCFEDAIAFVSVVMGSLLARWHAVHYGFDERFFTGLMPGSAGETWDDVVVWWAIAVLKMVVGTFIRLN
jgi:hypothetical protein